MKRSTAAWHARAATFGLGLTLATGLAWGAPLDGGIRQLQDSVSGRIIGLTGNADLALPRPDVNPQTALATLLASPLDANAAVRIALLNNPELQMALGAQGLDITDAAPADAPGKQRAQQALTVLSAQATKAWVQAVAAAHSVTLLRQAKETAQSANELMRRMVRVGNRSKLVQAQTQARLSEATVALARGEQAAFSARERLTVVLGLWGPQAQYALASSLPALPEQADDGSDVESRAVLARTDLTLASAQWERKRAQTSPATVDERWDALGDSARIRAQAVRVRSQAREAYYAYRSSFDIATHLHTEVVPLRKFINDELLLRYNGMLTSVFDVLADSQTQTLASLADVQAQRDFWLAQTDLRAVLAGAPLEALGSNPRTDSTPAAGAAPAGH